MANAERPGGGSGSGPRLPFLGAAGGGPFRRLLYIAAVAAIWVAIIGVAGVAFFARGLPDISQLYSIQRQPSISYLDRSGALITVRGSQFAPPVKIDELPEYVPAAFVAIEDRRFYHHWGFDLFGIFRAVISDLRHGRAAEGASTITQQLARNLFLTPDQTAKRKVQELILAVELEHKFSKKEILALYMNRVYFGAGAYGIEAAAQRYFNKPASKLTVGEAAVLAGLLKSPTHYSPISDRERAARRATIVLDKMVQTGAITSAQRDEAFSHPVNVSPTLASQHAQYFIDWVDAQVRQQVGQPTQDLVVETTLDLAIDAAALSAAKQVVDRDQRQGVEQAAVVALDGAGRVRALIGGVNYAESQFNRAVDARRQAGSSWKPFVYLTAMEAGRTPDTQTVDEPVTINGWSPQNYTKKYLGPMTLEAALAQSINTVAARLADEVGRDAVAQTAHRLGIESRIGTDPSMALGAVEVSPLEMAQAYAPFSNGGMLAHAYGIERIRTTNGKVLYEHKEEPRTSVITNPPLSYMNRMLRQVILSPVGTGGHARIPGYDIAGKTGTTSDYRDAWFVGYTGGFVTAVWVGRDDNTPMRRVTGGSTPNEIWRSFMAAVLPRLKVQAIPAGPDAPPGAVFGDPIADLLNQTANTDAGNATAPPATPTPAPAPAPAAPNATAEGLRPAKPAPAAAAH
ncbi:MAG: penicillin-binding protein 1A [Pseudomonadota bacterium]|jgi:penicillin-binding protein 1A